MTDQELKDLVADLAIQSAKTDAKLERIGKMVGGISNNQGDIAEEFFYNSVKDKPTIGGINYDFIDKNVTRSKSGIEDEYDILLVNGKDVAIIEVKYKTHERDLKRLLEKKYVNFKKLYPEYSNYNHHLVLASFYINDDLKNQALDNNITVLQRKGNVIETSIPVK
jgi:phage anti-repressor protein